MATSLLVTLGIAASFVPLPGPFTNVGAALVFAALIEGLTIWGRCCGGYVATVPSALWFDCLRAPPSERLTISDRPDLETTSTLVLVGATELSAQVQRHRERATTEGAREAMLAVAASLLAGSSTLEDVLTGTSSTPRDQLRLRSCHFETNVIGLSNAQNLADAGTVHVGMSWSVDEFGIPGSEVDKEWQRCDGMLGHFLVNPVPGETVTFDDRVDAATRVILVSALVNEPHGARG